MSTPTIASIPSLKPAVLVVDDETATRNLMSRWLQASGYVVSAAGTAEEALELQRQTPAAVALCDIRLPGHDGIWLANQLRDGYPETAVIMATGEPDVETAVAGLRSGIVDYLLKPFGRDQVCTAVAQGLARHRVLTGEAAARTKARAERRDAAENPSHAGLENESAAALDGMLAMLAMRDASAYEHACRVADLSLAIGRELGLPASTLVNVERAALLHDVGKMALPDSLLFKPGPLDVAELAMLRRFPDIACDMLRGLWPYLSGTADIVRSVLEWVDGSGRPRGLIGEQIPLGGRIISAADAFDTMTHPRAYRVILSEADALAQLEGAAGTQFDANVVQAMRIVLGLSERVSEPFTVADLPLLGLTQALGLA